MVSLAKVQLQAQVRPMYGVENSVKPTPPMHDWTRNPKLMGDVIAEKSVVLNKGEEECWMLEHNLP
ncbi:MAG: hypothetical protein HY774_09715 [Acidobacteria bacterium]|nr:hypothetical protein [Acidobacteriota bacterium]